MTADELEGAEEMSIWTRGDRLRKARAEAGLTVKEFAERIGVSEKTVNNAEGDKRAVRPITLNAWAWATGLSREWLATGQGNPYPSQPGQTVGPANDLQALTARKEAEAKRRRGFTDDDGDSDTHRYADPLQPTG